MPSASDTRRVAWSSYLGTTIEFYDFLLYGAAAAVVFNKLFFPSLSPLLGTIAALATLAAGYVARLAGGIVFGHFGDKYGRKSVLITTMVLMGVSSGLIGLLPTYQQIGALAPLLLLALRLVQGLAVGGEYGGAILMTAEYAPEGRRAWATTAVTMGAPSGSLLATATMAGITTLPEEQLLSWGWRLPFLFSFVLLALGLYLRYRIAESPVFLAKSTKAAARPTGVPLMHLLRTHPRRVAHGIAIAVGPLCGQGVLYIFITSYAPTIGYSRSQALIAVSIGMFGFIWTTLLFARLSDRIGRRPIAIYGALSTAIVVFPCFWLINMGNPVVLIVTIAANTTFVMVASLAVLPVLLSELFPTNIRYTGVSVAYQIAQMIGSGFSPLIAASLLAFAGGGTQTTLVAAFVAIVALGSAVAAWQLPETHRVRLTDQMGADQHRPRAGERPSAEPAVEPH